MEHRAESKGCVYLVGAGPGDPGLVTVRGERLIREAEVVIYDYLVAPRLVRLARADAEVIYVGKKGGEHTLSQDKINELIVAKAKEGRMVVRLKGGDPFVFGRGGEEALELLGAGVRFEVVPGVTAGVGAAAYAGIPTTHRGYASDLALITGHEDASRTGESQVDWESLGKWKGTLVFFMGVKNLAMICERLQEHGMSGGVPAALIRWGTTPRQQTLVGTVGTLAELAEKEGFRPPSIIVVGQVVSLRERLKWFEQRALFGRRIMVTRSRAQASDLLDQLLELGAEVLEFPTIRIEAGDEGGLRGAAARLGEYDWVIFTSVNGVEHFFWQLQAAGYDARRFAGVKICAIGPATGERLRSFGLNPDMIPPRFVAESVLEALGEVENLARKRVLLPRADLARGDLPEGLRQAGATVDEIEAYRTVLDDSPKEEVIKALEEDDIDWVTFTSSSTVKNFVSQVSVEVLKGKKIRTASIGPITSETMRGVGLGVDVEAEEFTIPGLVEALVGKVQG